MRIKLAPLKKIVTRMMVERKKDKLVRRVDKLAAKEKKLTTWQVWPVAVVDESSGINTVVMLNEVSTRNIIMETDFLFTAIRAQFPNALFFDCGYYQLVWRPPGSEYQMTLGLDDPPSQEVAVDIIRRLLPHEKGAVMFTLTPKTPGAPMFQQEVPKYALNDYSTHALVLASLMERYTNGDFDVFDLKVLMQQSLDDQRKFLHSLLPKEEQQYHMYLLEPTVVRKEKTLEQRFMESAISIDEYRDLKYPEQKARRLAEKLTYPQPYDTAPCVVCRDASATIACVKCPNKICTRCIERLLGANHDVHSVPGPLVLLHRRYCLKLGSIPIRERPVVVEPKIVEMLQIDNIVSP